MMRSLTSLRGKLTVLVALPLLVLVVAALVAARNANRAAAEAAATADRIDLAVAASTAALQLAQERALSASTLQAAQTQAAAAQPAQAPATEDGAVPEELEFQRDQTSEAVDVLRQAAGPGADDAPLGSALERLGRLDTARDTVDGGAADASAVLDSYSEIIDPVLDFDETLADVDDPTLITGISSHEALTRAIQDVAMEQSLLTPVFTSGQVDPAIYQQLVGVVTTQDVWLGLFEDKASMAQRQGYEELATVPAVATVQRLREQVLSVGPGGAVETDSEVWASATGRKLDLLEGIAQETADQLTRNAGAAASDAAGARTRAMGLTGGAALLTLAVLFLLWRYVLRPFGHHVSATQLALADGTPVPVPTDDELNRLASAFNQAQAAAGSGARAALGAAGAAGDGEEAAAGMPADRFDDRVYLRFGRRTQDLIGEQLRHIDELESRTEDPDTLADLFLLDHLATRLRRNAESQVVVAGADTPRPWSRPVSVTNVVRAAAAEAVDYSRVEVQPMPPASIVGSAANDVSHLLAELIDESLGVLPDHLRVVIGGARQRDGRYILAVSGVGLRLTPGEIATVNELLASADSNAGEADGNLSPGSGPAAGSPDGQGPDGMLDDDVRFRFYVAAHLARRHDIDVRLGHAPGGTIAEIVLPRTVLADGAPDPSPPGTSALPNGNATPGPAGTSTPTGAAAGSTQGSSAPTDTWSDPGRLTPTTHGAPPGAPGPTAPASPAGAPAAPPARMRPTIALAPSGGTPMAPSSPSPWPTSFDPSRPPASADGSDESPSPSGRSATGGQPSPVRSSKPPASRRRTGSHKGKGSKSSADEDERQPRFRRWRRKVVERASRRSVDPWAEWQDG